MNEQNPQKVLTPQAPPDDEIDILEVLMILKSKWKFLTLFLVLGAIVGALATMWMRPAYKSDILLQVDVKGNKSGMALGEMGALLDVSTPSEAEIQLIKSRMVLSAVVEQEGLRFNAAPLDKADRLTHHEGRMDLEFLQIPRAVSEAGFPVLVRISSNADEYEILVGERSLLSSGRVGETYRLPFAGDTLTICVKFMDVAPGQVFALSESPLQSAIEGLQHKLGVAEEGKNSGIIRVSLEHRYADRVSSILNTIGNTYLKQNIEMRSAEAKKTLEFLEEQLPGVKAKLDSAELKLTEYRHSKGTIDLTGETKVHLEKDVALQQQILELEQKKQDALRLFQAEHPSVRTIEQQQSKLRGELARQQKAAEKLPVTQQEVLSLQEEVEVNNKLYTNLLNNIQQLRVVQAGEVGNVRIVDKAFEPIKPCKPNKKMIFLGVIAGFFIFGCLLVYLRRMMKNGVVSGSELEQATGVGVYGRLPRIEKKVKNDIHDSVVHADPDCPVSEGIRALRTALDFSISWQQKVIMVSGLIEGVGKSFVATNLACSFAMAGKKVLLVDMDLRRGHLLEQGHKGLCEILYTGNFTDEYVEKVTENFHVIGAGKRMVNPGDLLGKEHFGKFLQEIKSEYDLIILDTPPVFQCSDALLVEKYADYLLCVLKYSAHSMESIQDALTTFDRSVDSPIPKAFVLNMCESRSGYGYKTYGYYSKKY